MTPAQTEPVENLDALRKAVSATNVLRTILDDDWFEAVERAIKAGTASPTDATGFLYDFCHPLRGADWFESNQDLALAGRLNEVSEDGQFAIAFAGLDPIRTMLPVIEDRLAAFNSLPFKSDVVKVKFNELPSAKFAPAFKNHLFELNVLGDLAMRRVLVDIEDGATGVDGVISLDGRNILVEATNTAQRVIPDFTGVFFGRPDVEIDQVVKKVRKKVADGRQLARAAGQPTILFLARTHMGAGRESADAALAECFRAPTFSGLSGAVLSDSYRLHTTSWRPGMSPDVSLTTKEAALFQEWYGVR